MRCHADRVAASLITNRRNVNRRSAMPANDVLPILAVAFRTADAASIQRHDPSVRLLDDHEPQRLVLGFDSVKMHGAVLHFANSHTHYISNHPLPPPHSHNTLSL